MNAAVIVGPGRAEVVAVPAPVPSPGELVIKMEGCGVCASNVPVWEGREWFSYPIAPGAPGHEGWGVVYAVGSGVNGFSEGDRVTFLSYHAYAEYDKASAEAVVRLPATLDGIPFPGESVGCAMNVFRRSDIKAGQTVAVIGAGFLGIIFTALAVRQGARVIAISRRGFALDMARAHGAVETVLLDDHRRVLDQVRQIAGEQGCERVVEATGFQWPLDLAGELVGEHGRIVIAGYHQDGPRQVNIQQWNWKGIDVINAHERNPSRYLEGMRDGVRAVESGALNLNHLITHTFRMDDLGLAYTALTERPEGFIKGILRMD